MRVELAKQLKTYDAYPGLIRKRQMQLLNAQGLAQKIKSYSHDGSSQRCWGSMEVALEALSLAPIFEFDRVLANADLHPNLTELLKYTQLRTYQKSSARLTSYFTTSLLAEYMESHMWDKPEKDYFATGFLVGWRVSPDAEAGGVIAIVPRLLLPEKVQNEYKVNGVSPYLICDLTQNKPIVRFSQLELGLKIKNIIKRKGASVFDVDTVFAKAE